MGGNPFEALDDIDDKDDVEEILSEDHMTRIRVQRSPP